jgi:hypothetical protein
MESVIDPDDSSNSNSKYDNSDYSTDTGEVTSVVAGTKQISQVGEQFSAYGFEYFRKLIESRARI